MGNAPVLKLSEPAGLTAEEDLKRQMYETGGEGGCANAHRMWRAVGSPLGHDPRSWLKRAEPLVVGLRGYSENLKDLPDDLDYGDNEVMFTIDEADGVQGARVGDKCLTFILAQVYAMYLDFVAQEIAKGRPEFMNCR